MATTGGAGRSQRHLREIQGVDSAGDTDEIPVGILPANTTPPVLTDTTPTMGDTLTEASVTSGIWTGSPTPAISKQIRKDNTPLILPYTLTEADIGAVIVGRVYATNVAGTVFNDTAPVTVAALALTPDNVTLPFITNSAPRVGNVISTAEINNGSWNAYPIPTYNQQLKVNGVNKTMPYTILSGDIGATMTVLVTATNIHGSGNATSLPTAPIQSSLASPVNTVLPSFNDTTPSVGDLISLGNTSQGTWTGNPAPTLTSVLKKAGTAVAMPYTVTEPDVGTIFTLEVTGTNSQGSTTAASAATSSVPPTSELPANTTLPSLVDTTPTVGDVISNAGINQGTWTGIPTPTFANQLKVNGVNKTMPYTVVSGDIGNSITVTVTATNSAGSVSATSSASTAVVAAPVAPANTVAPTMVDTTPTVGDVITVAGINTGTWTGVPTPTLAKGLQRAGADVAMPYTVVSGDVGVVFRGKVTGSNPSGSVDAFTANTSAVVPANAAPVNTVLPFLADQTPTVGDVINNASVNQGTWTGYPTPTLTNQLRRGTTNLTMPYTVTSGDIGLTFNVQVTGTSTSGTATATSAATSATVAVPVAPANTVAPSITTTNNPPRVGDTITSAMLNGGTWTGTPTPSVNTDLRRGTTVLTMPYTITSGDLGQTFNAYATATNGSGSVSQASAATAAVTPAWTAPVNTALPTFTDATPTVGDVISSPAGFSPGTWTGYPTPTYTYQLKKNGSNVTLPYTVVSGDTAATLTVTVTATSSGGTANATSDPVTVLGPPVNTVLPSFTDTTPIIGDVITTAWIVNGTWTGYPTPTYTQQLKKNGSNVSMPYTVVSGDAGATFTVTVTGTNSVTSVAATSAATTAVPSVSVPVNTVAPTINSVKARNPVVGDVFATTDITSGTWTNSPTSYTRQLKVGGVVKTMPYTYVSGDIGQTVIVTESATNAGGTGTAVNSGATQPVLAAAPAGSQYLTHITDITTPRYDGSGASMIYIPAVNKTFAWDADYNAYQLSTEDNIYYRFETRPGDTMDSPHPFPDTAGTERNRLVENSADWHTTQDFRWRGTFTVDQGFTSGAFHTFLESHTFGTGGTSAGAKQFETAIDTASKLWILANYSPTSGNPTDRTMWTATTNFVVGKEYAYDVFFRRDPTGVAGRLRVVLDGVEVVNFSGQTGHHVQSNYALEFGTYRGGGTITDTAVIRHKLIEMTFGAFNTLTDPNPPAGPVYGPELLSGQQPITAVTGWNVQNTTRVMSGGYLRVTNSIASGNTNVSRSFATTIGDTYEITAVLKNVSAQDGYVAIFGSSVFVTSSMVTATTDQTVTFTFVADSTTTSVFLHVEHTSLTGKSVDFKSVSARKKS